MAQVCDGFAATMEVEQARLVNAARLAWVDTALDAIETEALATAQSDPIS
jgi:hypothetical protein